MVAVRCRLLFLLLFFFFFSFSSFPHLSLSLTEQEALLQFKAKLTNTTALANWVPIPIPGSTPCSPKWTGVECADGGNGLKVQLLRLQNLGLGGKIEVPLLKELTSLRVIGFDANNFDGPIPDFSLLPDLKVLSIPNNKFSGEIPENFFKNMKNIKKLNLANNNFTGKFPELPKEMRYLDEVVLKSNQFTGKIPKSLTKLEQLRTLHLQNNQFSGAIPELNMTNLEKLDVSNNNLKGEVSDEMVKKYGKDSFAGNKQLCGEQLENRCKGNAPTPSPSPSPSPSPQPEQEKSPADQSTPAKDDKKGGSNSNTIKIVAGVVVGVMVLLVLVVFIRQQRKRKEENFSVLGKEKMEEHVPQRHEEVVEVHVPSSNGRSVTAQAAGSSRSGSSKKGGESKKGGSQKGGGNNDLLMVNDKRGTFGLPDLMKAAAEVLGNGGLGSAYKAVMNNGLAVVVKRMREMNRLGREGFDAAMSRLGRLSHKNILTPLAYHYRKEEKLLISDYISKGSLLYVLHGDRGVSHSELTWPARLKIIQGVASGMEFLHTEFASYDLPHGNLKSSNILLNEDFEPVLNDYAFHPLANPSNAAQSLFAFKTPEYIEFQQISPKSDVYCLGIVILEILTGKFPSQYLNNGKGGIDVVQWVQSATAEQREQELLDPEIESNAESVNQMLQLLKIGADCTVSKPDQRPDIKNVTRRILEVRA